MQNFFRPVTGLLRSLSVTIRAGKIKPAMHPMGIARVPRAVDKARSWSPNHTVASLLELFPKNTYAKAPRTFPSVAPTPKLSEVWIINSLTHAERIRRTLPIDKHTLMLSHLLST